MSEKTAISYQQQMINNIWAQAGMKALAEIANIYPRMTSTHDSCLFDDSFAMDFINYGDKIIYCAIKLLLSGKTFQEKNKLGVCQNPIKILAPFRVLPDSNNVFP